MSLEAHLQQLSVEDSHHAGALIAVGGRAALPLLEDGGQLLDLVPRSQVLEGRRTRRCELSQNGNIRLNTC